MKLQWTIFLAFFRSGLLGFGGGPSSIPLVHKEVVAIYKWMDDEEFSDVLALSNTLPGPMMTKMAGYIGYRVGGYLGMLIALIASILPTVILMIVLLHVFYQYKDSSNLRGMTNAIVPIVGVMLGILTWQFLKKAKKSMGWKMTLSLVTVSIFVIQIMQLHPAILIGVLLIGALTMPDKNVKKNGES